MRIGLLIIADKISNFGQDMRRGHDLAKACEKFVKCLEMISGIAISSIPANEPYICRTDNPHEQEVGIHQNAITMMLLYQTLDIGIHKKARFFMFKALPSGDTLTNL